jgi:hypothetical protein
VNRSLLVPLGRIGLGVAAITAAAVLSACSHAGNPGSSAAPANPPSASAAPSASPAAPTPPTIVGVTGGALVTLNPATGAVEQTLVPSGVLADEVSVAANGMIYFEAYYHCTDSIEAIPINGGTPAVIVAGGTLPAISPDGTKLAYSVANACGPPVPMLRILTLSNGATMSLPDTPSGQGDGLFPAISHLSWAADNQHLAVSIPEIQDNSGWALNIVDTAQAQYYAYGAGVTAIPITGDPNAQASYFSEGVYLPNGDLFVSRACCAGVPVHNTSRLMWEVTTSGAFVHQVAIGYPNLEHSSLDASSDGRWLLYVAHTVDAATLYVSQGGATPREVTTGIFAAAWA